MAWYAIYKGSDGSLVSVGTQVNPNELAADLTFKPIDHKPDYAKEQWDATTRAFVGKAVEPSESITIAANTLNSDTGRMLRKILEKMGVQVIAQ